MLREFPRVSCPRLPLSLCTGSPRHVSLQAEVVIMWRSNVVVGPVAFGVLGFAPFSPMHGSPAFGSACLPVWRLVESNSGSTNLP